MRQHDAYTLSCHACRREVEIPVQAVVENQGRCTHCDARLEIRWLEARDRIVTA